MNIIKGFPIAICYQLLGCSYNNLNQQLVADIVSETELGKVTKRTGGDDILQTNAGLEKKYDSFKQLSIVINNIASSFLHNIGVKEDRVTAIDFWGNINQSVSGFHMPHSHTSGNKNIYTGVYYPTSGFVDGLEIEEKFNQPIIKSESNAAAGSLVLLDPLEFVKTTTITNNVLRYPFFGNPIVFSPQRSLLILFPNYLPHMTIPNKVSNFKRISIAFNISIA